MKKGKRKKIIIILSVLVIGIIIFLTRDSIKEFYNLIIDRERLKAYIESFGYWSGAVFFIFQILQVVIFFIPGEVIQAAGGYIFGTFWGTVISLLGIGVGSYILFVVSHQYGRPFVEKLVSKELHGKIDKVLKNKNEKLIIFLLYLLPGLPKDSLVLVCGLREITPTEFIAYSMSGRIPALALSCYFGANLANGEHVKAIVVAVIAMVIALLGVLFKDKILKKLSKLH